MTDALYGPNGFYTTGRGSAGRRSGDFITSPEVGPLFGLLIGRWLDLVWDDLGRPTPFQVVDMGAGPGTLVTAIERSRPRCQPALAISSSDLADPGSAPTDLDGAVVIANELLDNLPFRWLRSVEGSCTEAFVTPGGLVWRDCDDVGPVIGEFPLVEQAAALLTGLLTQGVQRILAIDYGAHTTAELARRGGWLRCFRAHQRSSDPLHEPGHWDITTDVPVDQLPAPDSVRTQADFLSSLGIDQLVAEGRRYWAANLANPDLKAMEMRSRVNEAAALTDRDGLGSFLVMEWLT
ncbi:MAG: SAM-dependent methyltransferase [Acidimicrobiia bacterium]|nr:SAM-dependent methyltransferase [Acidimicrobiia bacterium]